MPPGGDGRAILPRRREAGGGRAAVSGHRIGHRLSFARAGGTGEPRPPTIPTRGGSTMIRLIALAAASAVVAGCAGMMMGGSSATARLEPTRGNAAAGTVDFVQKGDKVAVTAKVTGLTPGDHGFHIHEKGDCSSDDGMSAGGHFNPAGKPHAQPTDPNRHAGDMPMLKADASGAATLGVELDVIAIGSGAADVVGKAVIVHKDPDDFKTQPTGNSGARVACGVIVRN
jgi:Cu-Zn family superoxide dismutase